jgi:hypothetical protein
MKPLSMTSSSADRAATEWSASVYSIGSDVYSPTGWVYLVFSVLTVS